MKYAEYIKTVEIDALWGKRKHILWHLDRHVNILSGVNGIGKSTILQKTLKQAEGVHLTLVPEDATDLRYDVIEKYTIDPDTQLAKLEKDFIAYKAKAIVNCPLSILFSTSSISSTVRPTRPSSAMLRAYVSCRRVTYSPRVSCRQARSR